MKNFSFPKAVLLLIIISNFYACSAKEEGMQKTETTKSVDAATSVLTSVERGVYLVGILGCNDCHSPKIMTAQGPVSDPKRLLSGHPAGDKLAPFPNPKTVYSGDWVLFTPDLTVGVGPWGINYAANLTPDETGLGNWTYDQFKRVLTQGKSKGLETGRILLPPMPWQNYVNMKDEDVQAVYNYLKSIPAVSNLVPAPTPPVK
jgi:hypothetical protein